MKFFRLAVNLIPKSLNAFVISRPVSLRSILSSFLPSESEGIFGGKRADLCLGDGLPRVFVGTVSDS